MSIFDEQGEDASLSRRPRLEGFLLKHPAVRSRGSATTAGVLGSDVIPRAPAHVRTDTFTKAANVHLTHVGQTQHDERRPQLQADQVRCHASNGDHPAGQWHHTAQHGSRRILDRSAPLRSHSTHRSGRDGDSARCRHLVRDDSYPAGALQRRLQISENPLGFLLLKHARSHQSDRHATDFEPAEAASPSLRRLPLASSESINDQLLQISACVHDAIVYPQRDAENRFSWPRTGLGTTTHLSSQATSTSTNLLTVDLTPMTRVADPHRVFALGPVRRIM
jgi:hypothetical protein